MALPQELGHLVRLEVSNLFGWRQVYFDLDLKEPTLLTGTNGCGKSTILKLLSAIGRGEWALAGALPFDSATMFFENNVEVIVSRRHPELLSVDLNGELCDLNLAEAVIRLDSLSADEIEQLLPDVTQVRSGVYEYQNRILDREEITLLLRRRGIAALDKEEHASILEFTQKFHTLFVTDQRLVVAEDDYSPARYRAAMRRGGKSAAAMAANELVRQMRETLNAYASESQRLDREFPQRVVLAMGKEPSIPIQHLETLIDEIEQESASLQAVGLLPKDLSPDAFRKLPLDDAKVRPVIQAFAEDTKKKFAVLSDLRERLTLFTDFLNQHYEHKQVSTNTQNGFVVEIQDVEARRLPASRLSSGEQQILILAYEILFRAEPGTLVLIDEPELSLHVLWQDTFIEDVTEMGNVRNLQFVLATHSPSLIGGRDDLKRALDRF
jgi:ABC-type uncharacterized transport system ATPase subunit